MLRNTLLILLLSSPASFGQSTGLPATPCGQKIGDAYNLLRAAESSSDGLIEQCYPASDGTKNTAAILGRLNEHGKALRDAWDRYLAIQPRLSQIGDPDSQTTDICAAPEEVKQRVRQAQTEISAIHKRIQDETRELALAKYDFEKQYELTRWGDFFRRKPDSCQKTKANIAAVHAKLGEMSKACEKLTREGPEESASAIYHLTYAIEHGCVEGGCAAVNIGRSDYEVDSVDMYGRWMTEAKGPMTRDEADSYIGKHCKKEWRDD